MHIAHPPLGCSITSPQAAIPSHARSQHRHIGDLIWPHFFMTMRHIGGLSKTMSAESHPTSRMLPLTGYPNIHNSADATPHLTSLEGCFEASRPNHFQLSNEAIARFSLAARDISAASYTPVHQ
jgi:hypothetical protein